MIKTSDGYLSPENEEEMHEAVEHNTQHAKKLFDELSEEQKFE